MLPLPVSIGRNSYIWDKRALFLKSVTMSVVCVIFIYLCRSGVELRVPC